MISPRRRGAVLLKCACYRLPARSARRMQALVFKPWLCRCSQSSSPFGRGHSHVGCLVVKRIETKLKKTKLHGLSPRANYTDRATVACRRSDCQLLRIEGATWSACGYLRPYSRYRDCYNFVSFPVKWHSTFMSQGYYFRNWSSCACFTAVKTSQISCTMKLYLFLYQNCLKSTTIQILNLSFIYFLLQSNDVCNQKLRIWCTNSWMYCRDINPLEPSGYYMYHQP
jgi:hypothetical protein